MQLNFLRQYINGVYKRTFNMRFISYVIFIIYQNRRRSGKWYEL